MADYESQQRELQEAIKSVAGKFPEQWRDVGRHLGLSDPVLSGIASDYIGNIKEMQHQMLLRWKEKEGSLATLSALVNALLLVERKDLVETLKKEKSPNAFQNKRTTSSSDGKTDNKINMEHSGSTKASRDSSSDKANKAFGQFLIEVASLLTLVTVRKLATLLNYPPADIDEAEKDPNPGYVFVKSLRDKGIITPTDISTLLDTLKTLNLQGFSNDVLNSFTRHLADTQSPSSLPSNLLAKITSFISQIKMRYYILYNAVQPIPYIRDRLMCVNTEFIDSGIEFLKRNGAKVVWVRLASYHCILSDPRLASTRFILLGEPGFGKSTLALQLVYDWCNRCTESALKNVQILIFLRLRQMKGIKSIFRAIKQFLLPIESQLTISDIKDILCAVKSVVLVLDGFNEYAYKSGNEDDDVTKIISGRMFNEFQVVLTTRPSYKPETATPISIQLRLTGFDTDAQDKYIKKAVVYNDTEAMKRIRERLEENPILRDLCEVPIFFVMFAHIVHTKEKYANFDSVTKLFRYMIGCFHEHMKNKLTDSKVRIKYEALEKDHRKLDEVAFAAFTGKNQQIVWMKDDLLRKVGEDLYNQCIDVGILLEEETVIINDAPGTATFDVIQRGTQTRFFHKIFCEWFAAHFLSSYATNRSVLNFETTVRNLDAFELQYVFRFACGINPNASVKIINYLQTLEGGDKFAILCILERTGDVDDIKTSIQQLCREGVIISGHDNLLLQRSSMQLLEIAAKYDIPITIVYLHNCFRSVDLSTSAIRTTTGLALTSRIPVQGLRVGLYNREMTGDEYVDILEFSSMCSSLRVLGFDGSAPPRSFKVGPVLSTLCSRNVAVKYLGALGECPTHILNLLTGRWKRESDGLECTEEDFERMTSDWAKRQEQDLDDEYHKRSTDVANYERLKNKVSFMLREKDCTKLATLFELSSSQMDTIRFSRQPTKSLFFVLEEKGVIHLSNVSELEKAFSILSNAPCYNLVVSYQNLIMEISPYDKFNAQLASHITLSKARELCDYFKFTNNMTESIIASHNPGLSLLLELDKMLVINSTDVKALEDPFKKFQLVQGVAKIQEYQSLVTQEGSRLQQTTLLTLKDHKKILFIECLKKKMKYWYDTMTPVPWKRSCKWRSADLFVWSRLIFKESQSTKKHTVTDKKCKLQYRKIFSHTNLASAKRIIVEGEPGCGKTMLTAQLGYDWCQGFIEEVDILVLLPLKFVGNKTLLESIEEFYIPSTTPLMENDIDEILSSATDSIGVLLDGLEEYSYHESSEVAKVFIENKHPNWKVVLTSRSNCAADLPTFPTLQIDLFGEEERNKYIENLYVDNLEKQMEVKAAINNSAFILDLCNVPLLFGLAVHSLENEKILEKDHFERAGMFMRNMISTLTAKHDIQNDDIDGPKIEHSTNSMLYLGEVAFNGFGLERQQLYWQKSFLESNVENFQQWIDSGIFVIEEEIATTMKETKPKEELNMKNQDAVPQQYDDDDEEMAAGSNSESETTDEQESVMQTDTEEQGSVMQKDGDEQESVMEKKGSNISETDDTSNQTPWKDVVTENTTKTSTTTKHVPQMVKFLHKVVQEWFAAAYFSTMLKKCTNRDQYDEYVSEHLPHISPTDLHYLLRFACFLHPPFCHTVMNHLLRSYRLKDEAVPTYIMDCIFLCFAEHHGNRDTDIEEVVANVCTEEIIIHSRDSQMLQRAKCAMLKFASESMITIEKLHLTDVITNAKMYNDRKNDDEKYVIILNFGLEMNVLKTVKKVEASRWDRILKEDHFNNILESLSNGSDIKEITCVFPDPPPSTLMDKTRTKLLIKNITVRWIIGDVVHPYNPTEGIWECTSKRLVASSGRGSDQCRSIFAMHKWDYEIAAILEKAIETTDLLETSTVVSKRRCVLTIAGTGVELHIPPNAFQDHMEERIVTMRILPYSLDEPSRCFEDHSTAVVEILPNKKSLHLAAKLVLPHCLTIRNPRYCDVQVFQSHHEAEQKPDWKNISEFVSFALYHNCCEISLKTFCWVKYKVDGEEVIGKKLSVYATGDGCEEHDCATVDVGYYSDVPGADKFYQTNKGEHSVTQSFMFRKDPAMDLQIALTKIQPKIWKPETTKDVIKYDDIKFSVEARCSFILEKQESAQSVVPLFLCRFNLSKGDYGKDLLLKLKTTKATPNPLPTQNAPPTPSYGSMDETVTRETLMVLSPMLGETWKSIGRWLGLEDNYLDGIDKNNIGKQEIAYEMLRKWKQSNGQSATCKILEIAFKKVLRVDLVEKLRTLQGAS